MSLTPDRRTHFRRLCESPRHNHGTNLNPVPVQTGTLRELLDDADELDRLRQALGNVIGCYELTAASILSAKDRELLEAAACDLRDALEGTK